MDFLAALFVGKRFTIGRVTLALPAVDLVRRFSAFGPSRNPGAPIIVVGARLAYAIREAAVRWQTPEANIRIGLFLIWPAIAILTAVALCRALRRR